MCIFNLIDEKVKIHLFINFGCNQLKHVDKAEIRMILKGQIIPKI